jgi:hypothetical protein
MSYIPFLWFVSDAVSIQAILCKMKGRVVNNELEGIWKEAVVACSRYYTNRTPPEYK